MFVFFFRDSTHILLVPITLLRKLEYFRNIIDRWNGTSLILETPKYITEVVAHLHGRKYTPSIELHMYATSILYIELAKDIEDTLPITPRTLMHILRYIQSRDWLQDTLYTRCILAIDTNIELCTVLSKKMVQALCQHLSLYNKEYGYMLPQRIMLMCIKHFGYKGEDIRIERYAKPEYKHYYDDVSGLLDIDKVLCLRLCLALLQNIAGPCNNCVAQQAGIRPQHILDLERYALEGHTTIQSIDITLKLDTHVVYVSTCDTLPFRNIEKLHLKLVEQSPIYKIHTKTQVWDSITLEKVKMHSPMVVTKALLHTELDSDGQIVFMLDSIYVV